MRHSAWSMLGVCIDIVFNSGDTLRNHLHRQAASVAKSIIPAFLSAVDSGLFVPGSSMLFLFAEHVHTRDVFLFPARPRIHRGLRAYCCQRGLFERRAGGNLMTKHRRAEIRRTFAHTLGHHWTKVSPSRFLVFFWTFIVHIVDVLNGDVFLSFRLGAR
jgi:hypothetical protein